MEKKIANVLGNYLNWQFAWTIMTDCLFFFVKSDDGALSAIGTKIEECEVIKLFNA